jgi:hypothetical protein
MKRLRSHTGTIIPDHDVPPWIMERMAAYVHALCLFGWRFYVGMSDDPDGEGTADAVVLVDSKYFTATFLFCRDIANDEDGAHIILHELMHVALSPLCDAFDQSVRLFVDEYSNHVRVAELREYGEERTIESLVRALRPVLEPHVKKYMREQRQAATPTKKVA